MSFIVSVGVEIIVPLLYCLIAAGGYGILFKKRFSVSLSQAFLWQIIILTFTSIVFSSFTAGIAAGIAVALLVLTVSVVREKTLRPIVDFYKPSLGNLEVVFFLLLYFAISICNAGNFFHHSDEYAHWGIFVKEILRLDRLFYVSNANMAHKDYLPALSLFEALWCKLCFGFSEAGTYRGIQIFEASLVMPLLSLGLDRKSGLREVIKTMVP
jgi:hypothetical protein